ncbi:MAG: hypothetical protein IIY07_04800, partial [Thermoguttaceae bacterium]|nr:hypothetical protein [Thermoguttaceae bacterium]
MGNAGGWGANESLKRRILPYLPITNNYINKVLNIEAVSLNSIEVNTVPNFPRTIQATIRLQEFEY